MELNTVNRILVVGANAIGDALLSTPMVRTLKRAYPRSHLTYIIKAHAKDVLANHPDIDELLLYDSGILGRIAQRAADDLAINYAETGILAPTAAHAICLLSGAKYRVGWSYYQDMHIGHLKVYNVYADPGAAGDAIDLFLSLTRALGLEDAGRETKLVLTPEEEDFAESFWEDGGLTRATRVVGLHPGGRRPERLWAVKDYAQVADELMADAGCRILVFHGPGEEETAKSVCQAMQHQARLVPLLEIRKYAALVKKCHLVITSDGGQLHVAAAVGIKVLGIFRKEATSDYWFPYRDRPGCLLLVDSVPRRITVRKVLTAARQLLAG